jgi:hypothetical protein
MTMKNIIIEILQKQLVYEVDFPDPSDRFEAMEEIAGMIISEIDNRQCMYCEKELKPNEAIILCKDCTQ